MWFRKQKSWILFFFKKTNGLVKSESETINLHVFAKYLFLEATLAFSFLDSPSPQRSAPKMAYHWSIGQWPKFAGQSLPKLNLTQKIHTDLLCPPQVNPLIAAILLE